MAEFKSGFIALIGFPNAGKSTLLNRLIGRKVAIVSKKPQTTRTRICGVLTKKDYQMVFVDTPGIHKAHDRLDAYMESVVRNTMHDVDIILYLLDAKMGIREEEADLLKKISKQKIPCVVVLNKIDAIDDQRLNELFDQLDGLARPQLLSAKTGQGTDELLVLLERYLQPGPQYYPDEMLSDQPQAVFAGELIREKALKHLGKEIPHGIGISVERIAHETDKKLMSIDATIFCERESHKGIIIGKGGLRLKKIASETRRDMEELFSCKVYLQLWVKVKQDWRNQHSVLKILGYCDE